MERKRTTDLISTSDLLTENDCWMYQLTLERLLRDKLPPEKRQEYITMMALLAQQARLIWKYVDEPEA